MLVLMTGSEDDPSAAADEVLRKPFRSSELDEILVAATKHKAHRDRATTRPLPTTARWTSFQPDDPVTKVR